MFDKLTQEIEMYKVFIVLPNGHTMQIGSFDYADNARQEADYHRQFSGLHGVKFEVCYSGKTIYTR